MVEHDRQLNVALIGQFISWLFGIGTAICFHKGMVFVSMLVFLGWFSIAMGVCMTIKEIRSSKGD